jgi:dihydrodipicolinate synthase/N-acetylneuraminate lyase
MHQFCGVYSAAVTPRGKAGDIDFGAAFELIDHCSRGGVQGILLLGEEGEYAAFTPEERTRLAYLGVKRSRVPLLIGVGSPTVDVSVALARDAWENGAAAVVLPPPSLFHYGPEEVGEFYLQFAEQMDDDTTILLYNTPLSTSAIPVEIAAELLATGMFAGLIDGAGDGCIFSCLSAGAGRGSFSLLAGSDALFLPARLAGRGAVSAAACAVPGLAVALDRALASGDTTERESLERPLREFMDWVDRFPRPVIVGTALELQGLKTGPAAVPLSGRKLRMLDEFRDWFRGWLPAVKRVTRHG